MINVNFNARVVDPAVSYRKFDSIGVGAYEEKVLFTTNNLLKEVMNETGGKQTKKVKKLQKLLKVSLSVLAVTVQLAPKALANTATATGVTTITPAVVMQWGLTIALISVSAGVALSMTMLTVAGMYRMFRKKDKATEWTTDIIRGLVQVLIAVPTVYLLYFLAQILFQHLSVLKSLF